MPPKHEHVLTCNLSRRQRQLYDEYMARSEIRSVMSGGNFMGVINVLMQLRKVSPGERGVDIWRGAPRACSESDSPLHFAMSTWHGLSSGSWWPACMSGGNFMGVINVLCSCTRYVWKREGPGVAQCREGCHVEARATRHRASLSVQ